MKPAARPLVWLFLCLIPTLGLLAAPGKLTSTGPFGHLDVGVERLIFPGSDPRRILLMQGAEVFETRDHGANWRSVLANFPQIIPSDFEVDSANADHWYVASGGKLWQTRDAGGTFTDTALPLPDVVQVRIFLDAARPQSLSIEIFQRFNPIRRHYYSLDQGQSFTPVVHPDPNPNTFSPLLGIDRGVLWFKSYKHGVGSGVFTFHPDETDFGVPNRIRFADMLFFDRTRADTLYVAAGSYLHKSIDGGRHFESILGQGRISLIQSPTNPSHLVVFGSELRLSLDRGASWSPHDELGPVPAAAFDPATGEILFSLFTELKRRRLDGSLTPPLATNGLNALFIEEVAVRGEHAYATSGLSHLYHREADGRWQRRGKVAQPTGPYDRSCNFGSTLLISPADPDELVAACQEGIYLSHDGGWTWRISFEIFLGPLAGFYPPILALAGDDPSAPLYVLSPEHGKLYRSTDFGLTWEAFGNTLLTGLAVHPNPAEGLVAVDFDGRIHRYRPASGWQQEALLPSLQAHPPGETIVFGHHSAHPDLIYTVYGGAISRSHDFGRTWEIVTDLNEVPPLNGFSYLPKLLIDPFDADHWLLPYTGYETRDGGHSFTRSPEAFYLSAAFDPLTPGRILVGTEANGVLEKTANLPPCPSGPADWCARGGRYLLTVDWKDPLGQRGRATQVVTGSEDSGLFYFFDPNNWELLVKVLDGCGINQRHWLFAAGTTDVEYQLRVEDRWTGQIRHYFNPGGQAAAAITDTDAFAGCAATPPPGAGAAKVEPLAAAGEVALPLVNGRFEARIKWTDFAGALGDGLTAPLASDNSGLFYFFSPDNWEMLVKVLDGCAINGHYWLLAAATTDVGYELKIRDTTGPAAGKTYRNPVGRAAPAQIDLQAFSCQ